MKANDTKEEKYNIENKGKTALRGENKRMGKKMIKNVVSINGRKERETKPPDLKNKTGRREGGKKKETKENYFSLNNHCP